MSTAHSRPIREVRTHTMDSPNQQKRKATSTNPTNKRAKFLEPVIYNRLIRPVQLTTPNGNQTVQALFDTGSNVFVIDQNWATTNSIFQVQRQHQLNISGFAGQNEASAGKAFTPHLQLSIGIHTTSVSCELATLEPGVHLIIPGGWFLVQHPVTFHDQSVQVQTHECHSPPGIIYDDELIHDPEARIIGAICSSLPHTN